MLIFVEMNKIFSLQMRHVCYVRVAKTGQPGLFYGLSACVMR